MSFQDFGAKRPTKPQNGRTGTLNPVAESNSFDGSLSSKDDFSQFSQLRDGIVQYQRNVGILKNIAKKCGTKHDGPETKTQYGVQVDVIQQLGTRIESQLQTSEADLRSISSRTEAARSRATYVKLARDFRSVEVTFKNITLEVRQRLNLIESKKLHLEDEQQQEDRRGEDRQQLQMQLQQEEDAVNLQIMREREEEIRNINQGMHTVNEIYKDLAYLVEQQQEDVDKVEVHMENANASAQAGLTHVEKANENAQKQCLIS
eukprot:CAMPEP_0195521790 /NCGR_PEP_ID=MMETSP0794_2-20130614/19352_1 /TAXON_ID=515487 /ORGANISM="Stephanopyxis turris, Strain CCMP 815" /LENGTH=260 /DNA_ID=CAMNT_0040651411 /DNA_START=65 /DNA_END=847 /DNA_ORIENTATION=+